MSDIQKMTEEKSEKSEKIDIFKTYDLLETHAAFIPMDYRVAFPKHWFTTYMNIYAKINDDLLRRIISAIDFDKMNDLQVASSISARNENSTETFYQPYGIQIPDELLHIYQLNLVNYQRSFISLQTYFHCNSRSFTLIHLPCNMPICDRCYLARFLIHGVKTCPFCDQVLPPNAHSLIRSKYQESARLQREMLCFSQPLVMQKENNSSETETKEEENSNSIQGSRTARRKLIF